MLMWSSSLLLTLKLPLLLLSASSHGEDPEGARLRQSPELSHTWVLASAWWYQDALPTGTKQEATPPVSTSNAQRNWSRDRPGSHGKEGQKLLPPPSQLSPGRSLTREANQVNASDVTMLPAAPQLRSFTPPPLMLL